jgi:lipoprotein-releasing system permease protein
MLVVAVGTAALVIVLSVFNGLEGLIRTLYTTFDAEIKVATVKGKSFELDSAVFADLYTLNGIEIVTKVLEENALIEHRDDRRVVKVKGVSDNFLDQKRMDSAIVEGEFILRRGNRQYAIIGRGIQYSLNVGLDNDFYPLKISFPNNKKILNPTAHDMLISRFIPVSAVFAIEKQYDDNYIFTPLKFAESLFNKQGMVSSLEIKTKPGSKIRDVKKELKNYFGENYLVQDSDEQHASLLRAIKIEKLFVFIVFTFLLLIASVNIFFSLTMLSIEKKKDVAILLSLGSSRRSIKKLFLIEGLIIALLGSGVGLLFGFSVCWIQEHYGLVSMGMETSVVDAYPVQMKLMDFVYTGLVIILITITVSYRPAWQASRVSVRENI